MPGFTGSYGAQVNSAFDVENFSGVTFATSTTAAQTAALAEGVYRVHADALTFIKVAPTATDVLATNGCPIGANTAINVVVRQGSRIGAIVGTGTGNVYIHRVA